MNNILPDYLQSILDDCLASLDLQNVTTQNLSKTQRALTYYYIYKEKHIDAIILEKELKGLSLTFVDAAKFFEIISYKYLDTLPTLLSTIHCYELIKSLADINKRKLFLKMAVNSSKPLAFCLTEETAGSDITSIQTTAVHDNNSFVLNGKKVIVINGGIASYYVVLAKSSKKGRAGLNAFLVPESTAGISTQELNIQAFKNCVISSVQFNNVVIDEEYQIGDEGSGYFLLTEMLDKGRPLVAACCVGGAQRTLDIIVEQAKKRKQFQKKLFDFQGISFQIADFETKLHAARLLYLDACLKIDNNEPFSKEASMSKYYASKLFLEITNFGMDVMGYSSMIDSSEIKHLSEIAQAMRFIDGTENVQKMIIASLI